MGKYYSETSADIKDFIARQKIIFVRTATDDGRVNIQSLNRLEQNKIQKVE